MLYHGDPFGVKETHNWDVVGRMVRPMTPVWDDAGVLGQAIREARGPKSQEALGEWLGVSKKKVGRWEAGDERSLGDTPQKRRAVAILVAEATGRRDLLGLSEPQRDADLEELRRVVAALAVLATTDPSDAERQLLEGELDAARRWSPSNPQTGEPGTGAGNG